MKPAKIEKTAREVAYYHDIIDDIRRLKLVDFSGIEGQQAERDLACIHRTLCWILGHDGGRWLDENMNKIIAELREHGHNWKPVI